jgi:hypothetical protein
MKFSVRTKLILLSAVAMIGIAVLATTSQVETGRVYTAASDANDVAAKAPDEAQFVRF